MQQEVFNRYGIKLKQEIRKYNVCNTRKKWIHSRSYDKRIKIFAIYLMLLGVELMLTIQT